MIVRIADDDVVIVVNAQPAGPAIAIVRRRPGMTQKLAVPVKGLDAGSPIDKVQPVFGINRDRPRLDEIAVRDAALAPDELGLLVVVLATGEKHKCNGKHAATTPIQRVERAYQHALEASRFKGSLPGAGFVPSHSVSPRGDNVI
jgi:hypothetical protein